MFFNGVQLSRMTIYRMNVDTVHTEASPLRITMQSSGLRHSTPMDAKRRSSLAAGGWERA